MKIRISYFYQIRNFLKNMIPVSTAMWDPQWYHNGQGPQHIFIDKRGIINGLRIEPLINLIEGEVGCPCINKDPTKCEFIKKYRQSLEKADFEKIIKELNRYAEEYKKLNNMQEEIIIVLIVYETPTNPCSERAGLIDYFTSHGIECKELDYPIQKLNINKGEFKF